MRLSEEKTSQPQFKTTEQCLQAISQALTQNSRINDRAQVDHTQRESSMRADNDHTQRFFDTILPQLITKQGVIDSRREKEIIAQIVNAIQIRLENALQASGKNAEEAKKACDKSKPRSRQTIPEIRGGKPAWDDVSRYHTALRVLHCDTNIIGAFASQYFDGRQGCNNRSYRSLLAYLWLGATEDNMQPALSFESLSASQLKDASVENFISELAHIRREHNGDSLARMRERDDRPTCGSGVRGRLFKQLLICNASFADTTQLNLTEIASELQDFLIEKFSNLDPTWQYEIIKYYDSKVMLGDESDPKQLQSFLQSFDNNHIVFMQTLLIRRLNDPHNTQHRGFRVYYNDLTRRASSGDNQALLLQAIANLIRCQIDKFKGDNVIQDSVFLLKISSTGLKNYIIQKNRDGGLDDLSEYLTKLQNIFNFIEDLTDKEIVRRLLSPQDYANSSSARERHAIFKKQFDHYQQLFSELEQTYAVITADKVDVKQQIESQLDSIADQVHISKFTVNLGAQMAHLRPQILSLAPKLQDTLRASATEPSQLVKEGFLFVAETAESKQDATSSRAYARYLWHLVTEKNEKGEYYLTQHQGRDELDRALDLVLGNDEYNRGIRGLSELERTNVFIELNKLLREQRSDHPDRSRFLDERLRLKYNVNLNHFGSNYLTPDSIQQELVSLLNFNEADESKVFTETDEFAKCSLILPYLEASDDARHQLVVLSRYITFSLMQWLDIQSMHPDNLMRLEKLASFYYFRQDSSPQPLPFPVESNMEPKVRLAYLFMHLERIQDTLSTHPDLKNLLADGILTLMDRTEVHHALHNHNPGKFFIRISNRNPSEIIISFKSTDGIEHYHIKKHELDSEPDIYVFFKQKIRNLTGVHDPICYNGKTLDRPTNHNVPRETERNAVEPSPELLTSRADLSNMYASVTFSQQPSPRTTSPPSLSEQISRHANFRNFGRGEAVQSIINNPDLVILRPSSISNCYAVSYCNFDENRVINLKIPVRNNTLYLTINEEVGYEFNTIEALMTRVLQLRENSLNQAASQAHTHNQPHLFQPNQNHLCQPEITNSATLSGQITQHRLYRHITKDHVIHLINMNPALLIIHPNSTGNYEISYMRGHNVVHDKINIQQGYLEYKGFVCMNVNQIINQIQSLVGRRYPAQPDIHNSRSRLFSPTERHLGDDDQRFAEQKY